MGLPFSSFSLNQSVGLSFTRLGIRSIYKYGFLSFASVFHGYFISKLMVIIPFRITSSNTHVKDAPFKFKAVSLTIFI